LFEPSRPLRKKERRMTTSAVIDLVEIVAIAFLILGAVAFVVWFIARLDREENESKSP